MHPELRSGEGQILKRLRAGVRIEHFETERVTKDKKRLTVSLTISPVKDASGKMVGASKTARDVTQSREVEMALRESEQRMRFSLEAANFGSWNWDILTGKEQWSWNMERIHRQSAGSFAGNFESFVRVTSGRRWGMQDDERRSIARELHDTAGQILVALSLNLVPLEQELAKRASDLVKPVRESLGLVDELSRDLRTISHLLHPPLLDEAGLPSALRWPLKGFSERSKGGVDLHLAEGLGRLPAGCETVIYPIGQ